MKVMAIVLCVFIVFRHRSNIKRLAKGQENRVLFPFRNSFYLIFKISPIPSSSSVGEISRKRFLQNAPRPLFLPFGMLHFV